MNLRGRLSQTLTISCFLGMILEDLKTTERDFDIRAVRHRVADEARRDA
ncbi:MAG: hypothetical protein ACLPTF_05345 [Steroidobacteraceae bacterium]